MIVRVPALVRWSAMAVAVIAATVGFAPGPASAADDTTEIEPRFAAPVVVLDRNEVRADERLVLTIAGFRSPNVTAAICGNDARRGSSDCDMPGSKAVEMRPDGNSTVTDLVVSRPGPPCPCVVRVASPTNDEIAVAELTLVGHPVGEVSDGSVFAEPLAGAITATRTDGGVLDRIRSSLGGSTEYDVTVTIRNRTSDVVDGITLEAWAGRGDRVLASFDVESPVSLEPGETWEGSGRVALNAPVHGTARWRLDVLTPNAATVVSSYSTSHFPWLLVVAGLVLFVDLVVLGVRLLLRLRRARNGSVEDDGRDRRYPVIDLTGPEPLVATRAATSSSS